MLSGVLLAALALVLEEHILELVGELDVAAYLVKVSLGIHGRDVQDFLLGFWITRSCMSRGLC